MSIKQKIAALKRDNTNRLKSLPKGNNHWNWNENPSKLVLHKRLDKKYGKARWHNCTDCGKQAQDWSNETGEYSDDIKDYVPRCRSCHVKKDFSNETREKMRKITNDRKRTSKGRFISL